MSTDPDVHELLLQLHHQLKHADTISDQDRRLFNHLAEQVQQLIDKPNTQQVSLTTKLKATVADIETSHPVLATLMERVTAALSNTGI